jgi:hypothetical protein
MMQCTRPLFRKRVSGLWIVCLGLLSGLAVHCSSAQLSRPDSSSRCEDDKLLSIVERQTFRYFWEGADSVSGMARERIHVDANNPMHDDDVIAVGGSGFGIMAVIAAMERGFIQRADGYVRIRRITDYLARADRFHGAWPHWLRGDPGKVKPFSPKDDGGDIVETSYLMAGLLCAREYFGTGTGPERRLASSIDTLWRTVEWDWYTNGKQVLYWHWSPVYAWAMNLPIRGYNECLITYVLAASSPTHPIVPAVYHEGWARGGAMRHPTSAYGYSLELRHNGADETGGPLFWAHYSFLGLDPRGLKDRYADYWTNNVHHTLINYEYCVRNPRHFKGYGADNWGLTASYSLKWYAAHSPSKDLGVIAPTAAISSLPYTPLQSMRAIRHWFTDLGGKLWGPYGFYDAFSEEHDWFPRRYLAIDQGPSVVMIENFRSGLLWDLFMSAPEIERGLRELGFESPHSGGGREMGRGHEPARPDRD